MPKKIGQLVGATKIHEIVFEGDKIKKKNMPNECSYQPVKIKVGRQIVRQMGIRESRRRGSERCLPRAKKGIHWQQKEAGCFRRGYG